MRHSPKKERIAPRNVIKVAQESHLAARTMRARRGDF
jgi:hypothetical protein